MLTEIVNGVGPVAYRAKVMPNGRLWVESITEDSFHYHSESGVGWRVSTPIRTLTAVGGRFLWLAPNAGEDPAHVFQVVIAWNGGNTNHNRMCEVEVYYGDAKPTGNQAAATVLDPIAGAVRVPSIDTAAWTGVGDGMTGGGGGARVQSLIVGPGTTVLWVNGNLMARPVDTAGALSFNLRGEEAGTAAVALAGYQEELPT